MKVYEQEICGHPETLARQGLRELAGITGYFLYFLEELYKTSRNVIGHCHAKSERGIRQETCAAFTLVALARQFANRCDADINDVAGEQDLPDMCTNFRNGLRLVGREIEAMFLQQSQFIARSVGRIMTGLSRCIQRERPGRSHPRESKRPRSKWTRKSSA